MSTEAGSTGIPKELCEPLITKAEQNHQKPLCCPKHGHAPSGQCSFEGLSEIGIQGQLAIGFLLDNVQTPEGVQSEVHLSGKCKAKDTRSGTNEGEKEGCIASGQRILASFNPG